MTYSDTTHSNELFGWRAEHGLAEIVETTYRWHLRQLDET